MNTTMTSTGTGMQPHRINAHIEIVGSSNPRLNAMAVDASLSIAKTLRTKYAKVGISIVNNLQDLRALVAKKPDLVILGMKLILLDPTKSYDDSPRIWLPDFLKQHGIAYTGSETSALKLEFEKQVAKKVTIDAGLQSSDYFVSRVSKPTFEHDLRFPLFVKPTNLGDSKGVDEMSVVHTNADLVKKVADIHARFDSDVLVEEYLPGREFSVAIIRDPRSNSLLAYPVEITTPANKQGHTFLSAEVKDADTEIVLAVDDPALYQSLSALGIGVFTALGSRDYGRIDMRLDDQGKPSFIEANLMPGLSDHGYLTRCFALSANRSYADMIHTIATLGFARQNKRVSASFSEIMPHPDTAPVLINGS